VEHNLEKGQAFESHNQPLKYDRDAGADDEPVKSSNSGSDPGQSGAAQRAQELSSCESDQILLTAPDNLMPGIYCGTPHQP
jgi:hypothetical protein